MFATIMSWIGALDGVLWSTATFAVLGCAGLLFTVWTRFVQWRALTHGVQVTRGVYDDPSDPGAINHFQALSAALSATIGLGNIGGVALAIGLGGPGALFWMWILGLLGMALKTVEITLAMIHRNTDDPDNPHGGAMWVVDRALGKLGGAWKPIAKIFGGFFCVTLLISTITGGNMFQAWNVADLLHLYFGVPRIGTGIVLAILVGLVIVGGIKRIGHVAGHLVPIMCILYVLSALAVVFVHIGDVPGMLLLVVRSAFEPTAAGGAFVGATASIALTVGVKRALFSNEAGQGSAPIAHSAAKTDEPAREGIVGGIGPFIDTIIICTLTAMVILLTGTWNREALGDLGDNARIVHEGSVAKLVAPTSTTALPELPAWDSWQPEQQVFLVTERPGDDGQPVREKLYGTIGADLRTVEWGQPAAGAHLVETGVYRDFKGAGLTAHAFDRQFPGLGKWLVTLAAFLFAVSTMISWSYYGEQGVIYLVGQRGVLLYKLAFLALTVIAPIVVTTDAELGDLADLGTGWMLWANMPIVLVFGYQAVRSIRDYNRRLDSGQMPRHGARTYEAMVHEGQQPPEV